jgi:hypothetical protein
MNIYARSALIGFFVFSLTGVLLAGDYYIYRDSKGLLVISNQKPPAGSQIIRQRTLPDEAENEPAELKTNDVAPGRGKALKPAQPRQ